MFAATEMVLEEPDVDEALVTREVCSMVCLYYSRFVGGKAAPSSEGEPA
jgi:hypothetical protein